MWHLAANHAVASPGRHDIDDTVQLADISLNSSLTTMTALSEAAVRAGTRHGVIVMVDVGDLREGVWPDHLVDVVSSAAALPGIDVKGSVPTWPATVESNRASKI